MSNSNASSSVFGWEFQISAAIFLTLIDIKDIENIRIEGQDEDIELLMSNNKKLYIQAKSHDGFGNDSQATSKFSKSIETLSSAKKNNDFHKLIYIVNYTNPLGKGGNPNNIFKDGLYRRVEFPEIPLKYKDASLKKLTKQGIIETELTVIFLPFNGSDFDTRYNYISQRLKEFLVDLNIKDNKSRILLDIWRSDFFFNASQKNTNIDITKRQFLWPLIYIHCGTDQHDTIINHLEEELDLTDEDIETIITQYDNFIDDQTERFSLMNEVMVDFNNYSKPIRTKKWKGFINERWKNYVPLITMGELPPQEEECVIKVILYIIINSIRKYKNIQEKTGI